MTVQYPVCAANTTNFDFRPGKCFTIPQLSIANIIFNLENSTLTFMVFNDTACSCQLHSLKSFCTRCSREIECEHGLIIVLQTPGWDSDNPLRHVIEYHCVEMSYKWRQTAPLPLRVNHVHVRPWWSPLPQEMFRSVQLSGICT